MAIDIPAEIEQRLLAGARAEGVPLDTFLVHLVEEHEEIFQILHRYRPIPVDEMRDRIEHGYCQSERGDVVDGETFASGLLGELDEMDQTRRVG